MEIIGLFCGISSLIQGPFVKETYNFKEPINRSHPISVDLDTWNIYLCQQIYTCIWVPWKKPFKYLLWVCICIYCLTHQWIRTQEISIYVNKYTRAKFECHERSLLSIRNWYQKSLLIYIYIYMNISIYISVCIYIQKILLMCIYIYI